MSEFNRRLQRNLAVIAPFAAGIALSGSVAPSIAEAAPVRSQATALECVPFILRSSPRFDLVAICFSYHIAVNRNLRPFYIGGHNGNPETEDKSRRLLRDTYKGSSDDVFLRRDDNWPKGISDVDIDVDIERIIHRKGSKTAMLKTDEDVLVEDANGNELLQEPNAYEDGKHTVTMRRTRGRIQVEIRGKTYSFQRWVVSKYS